VVKSGEITPTQFNDTRIINSQRHKILLPTSNIHTSSLANSNHPEAWSWWPIQPDYVNAHLLFPIPHNSRNTFVHFPFFPHGDIREPDHQYIIPRESPAIPTSWYRSLSCPWGERTDHRVSILIGQPSKAARSPQLMTSKEQNKVSLLSWDSHRTFPKILSCQRGFFRNF